MARETRIRRNASTSKEVPEKASLIGRYHTHIQNGGRESRFLVALAFLVTFAVVRFITYSIRYGWLPFLHNVQTRGGLHIHHLVYGIALLLLVGYVALAFPLRQGKRLATLAVLYGIGAALTLDEFALWLNLEDVYWARQGRESVDVAIAAAAIFALGAAGAPFWQAVWRDLTRARARFR